MDGTEFTIFFEDPFWVGLFVADRGDRRVVARVVFGAEPANAELLQFMRERFADLVRDARPIPPDFRLSAPAPAMSIKRGIRRAAREQRDGPSKAIAAAHAAFELAKAGARGAEKGRRDEEAERRFAQRQAKRKRARRGK